MLFKKFSFGAIALSLLTLGLMANSEPVKSPAYISTNATSQKEVEPNVAEISFTVETKDKTVDKATTANKNLSNSLITSLKSNLDTNDTLTTTNFNVRPEYSYPKDSKPVLEGYSAINTVKVKTKTVNKIPKLIDSAIKAGITQVGNLNFSLDNPENICNELYPAAVNSALNQASIIAKSLKTEVLGIRKITSSCEMDYNNNYPRVFSTKTMSDNAGSSSYPVESGTIKVRAVINGEFNLK